jgi:hypothetical protein
MVKIDDFKGFLLEFSFVVVFYAMWALVLGAE